ncbi:iron(III) transport system ATP-binding protein [Rhodococcus sp. SMB37]|uniref:ABC transporter ATP-binding protein n=1 Tax=Rhodococcus sp. SMB37 TaxID=2512213 RepID=UPI001051ED09|nr:ABC transporter ATP-binding protein [Rhodococcus sp. SMB37]TCN57948.1 iron(III) transport system ATP-binding protein [Rhodococcus sp. SMB37]
MSAITLTGVHLHYPDGTAALTEVDIDVHDGEFIALVGPSGSGKTTLLRTVAGFLEPTAGTVRIGDDTVADGGLGVPPEKRHLGMVFQQHAIWPHRSVGRNVSYPLEIAKMPRVRRTARVAEVLDLVGLTGFEKRDPATLSGGQRQRVALARALVSHPRALLLDEALSALDEPLRDRLRLELRTLTRARNLTVLHVTHDRAEALALADRVAILEDGRIRQIGTPEEVVSRPKSAFVARFLSDANVLRGSIDGTGFRSDDRAVTVSSDVLRTSSRGSGALAVLPSDVELVPPAAATEHAGVVVSSLFGRDASDVVVTCGGVDFRCAVRGLRPAVGEHVGLEIRRALFYPDDPAAERTPVTSAAR